MQIFRRSLLVQTLIFITFQFSCFCSGFRVLTSSYNPSGFRNTLFDVVTHFVVVVVCRLVENKKGWKSGGCEYLASERRARQFKCQRNIRQKIVFSITGRPQGAVPGTIPAPIRAAPTSGAPPAPRLRSCASASACNAHVVSRSSLFTRCATGRVVKASVLRDVDPGLLPFAR